MQPRVIVVGPQRQGSAEGAELRYLDGYRRLQVERGLGPFAAAGLEEAGAALTALRPERVLLLRSERVLIGAASLRAMGAALGSGADVAVPARLADAGAAVHTLREYEELEGAFLSPRAAGGGGTPAAGPVSLWRPEPFARLLARGAATALSPASPGAAALRVARCGLFHEFIDYYGEVRVDVLPFVPEGARDVLEVGCARGLTGELLQQRLGCRVTGVELNGEVAAEAAARLHRVVVGDVETLELPDLYDAVLALELFEHLVDPMAFVRRMLGRLRPGGRIVLSTPNVGHYSIVRDLLAGRWDYLPIGLLCYTHLRFFTRATLADWLQMAGSRRFRIEPQLSDLPAEVEAWATGLGADLDSLRTTGFWVLIDG